jgi:hypothetical protein
VAPVAAAINQPPHFLPPRAAWSITMEIPSETLPDEDLATITGYQIPSRQLGWLNDNGWKYVLTGARKPIVGRVYARMKLAGVRPSAENVAAEAWSLDLSRVG